MENLTMATTELRVEGMTCGHCAQTVTRSLQQLSGVERAQVDLDSGSARVEYDPNRTRPEEMVEAVREEGYSAQLAS